MKETNYIRLEFPSRSSNESFARAAAAAFAAQLDPTMEELGDLRTAVSEAVVNVEREKKAKLEALIENLKISLENLG